MTLIASSTVGAGGVGSITFSSIPATYTDLKITVSARGTNNSSSNDSVALVINGDTGNNYPARRLYGTGSVAGSDVNTSSTFAYTAYTGWASSTANTFGNTDIYIPNYAGSNQKSMSSDGVSENNSATAYESLVAGLWTGTSAITSLNLAPVNGTGWAQYSTFYLYGIKNS